MIDKKNLAELRKQVEGRGPFIDSWAMPVELMFEHIDTIESLWKENAALKSKLKEETFLCPDCEAPLKAIKRMDNETYWTHPVYECPTVIHERLNRENAELKGYSGIQGSMSGQIGSVAMGPFFGQEIKGPTVKEKP